MSDPISPAAGRSIDVGTFGRAIGVRAAGCAVVTARDSSGPAGFLALSATHLCAAPPMLMVSIDRTTHALDAVRNSGHFAINYLAAGSEDLATVFAGKTDLRGSARFVQGSWTALGSGAPILRDAVGALDCILEETLERHGTVLAIGRLVDFVWRRHAKPLVNFGGRTFACGCSVAANHESSQDVRRIPGHVPDRIPGHRDGRR